MSLPTTEKSVAQSAVLPIADAATVRRHAATMVRHHRSALTVTVALHAMAAVVGLVAPRLFGELIERLSRGMGNAQIDRFGTALLVVVLLQTALTWWARRSAYVLGETVFADLRERFIDRLLALPLSTVERAGTGELVSRTTNDVDALSYAVRFGVPATLVAAVTTSLTLVAAFLVNPLVALALLVTAPLLALSTRRYLRFAGPGYARERASYAVTNGVVTENVEGARTIDALSLQDVRRTRLHSAIRGMWNAELYTLKLRMWWFPAVDLGAVLPVGVSLLWGGYLVAQGHASLGQVVTIVLYALALGDPVDELLTWLDEIQVGASALARIIGIEQLPPDRKAGEARPADSHLVAHDVRYSYRAGREVLHGIDLDLRPGERLAVVGPSGAGKSTLGRLLAGIDKPTSGTVDVGGVPLTQLPLDDLRGEVALVTQEHHVFVGTLRDNLVLADYKATDEQLWSALRSVDALSWAAFLPDGLDSRIGQGGLALTDAAAQQLSLARLVLADPHTLVLDEATSLLDPRAARHLERSMNAVLADRTVVAIAHRLHTAHDADRVAVVQDGMITEIGPHADLVAADGAYAALWRTWHDQ
ncbi:MAG: ABC transporter ATP-binding protein [Allobranchiibius sp.]